ncbi:MAG: hypothetical protein Q8Q47_01820, partial [Ignavibacteriaceae bacterium]|nr:hypothetical protein [Ignavibacteriaceae bacterium]
MYIVYFILNLRVRGVLMNILFLHSNNFYSINFLNNCIDMLYDLFDKLRNYGHTVKMLTVNDRIQKSEPEAFTYGSLKIIPKRLKYSFQNEILLLNNIIMLNNVESNISPTEKYDIIHCFDLESSICSKLLKDRFNAKLIFNFTDNFLDE